MKSTCWTWNAGGKSSQGSFHFMISLNFKLKQNSFLPLLNIELSGTVTVWDMEKAIMKRILAQKRKSYLYWSWVGGPAALFHLLEVLCPVAVKGDNHKQEALAEKTDVFIFLKCRNVEIYHWNGVQQMKKAATTTTKRRGVAWEQ